MLRMSKKMFYAVEAVLYLAYNAGSDAISGRDIARRQGLPPRYLEGMLQQLVHAGILRSLRGPKGGYVLARERRRITLADICRVVRAMDPVDAPQFRQTPLSRHIAFPLYERLEHELDDQLAGLNLATLCEQAKEAGVPRASDQPTDYAI